MKEFIDTLINLKKGSLVFFSEGVAHSNIESLIFLNGIVNYLKEKRKTIKIYMEGPKIFKNKIKQQLLTLDSGFNSWAFFEFYSSLIDCIEFVDIQIWEMYPNKLEFSDKLMTEYQKTKDEFIYQKIVRDMEKTDCDLYFIYFGVNHSLESWYDKYSKIEYKRLYFYLTKLNMPIIICNLVSKKKIDYMILKRKHLSNRSLSEYEVTKQNDSRYIITLPSISIDCPLILLSKKRSKKNLFRYPKFYKYKMYNYKFLSEKEKFICLGKFKAHISKNKNYSQLLYELRLYFSLGTLFSESFYINSKILLNFIQFVVFSTEYIYVLFNYLVYLFLTRVEYDSIDIKENDIIEFKKIIDKKQKFFMSVTVNDKKLMKCFFYMLKNKKLNGRLPKINEKKWCYRNTFSWFINDIIKR